MKITAFSKIIVFTAILTASCVLSSVAAESPKSRIDYWQKTYGELKPENDSRAARAQEIFTRVLNAAGKRSGVVPRLLVINYNSLIASAIPDGGIIISKKVLDICYKNPERGDDRLAFVLGHEIAHQLKDDFWHMKFFQAIELSKEKSPEQKKALEEVKSIAGSTEKVLAKELQADEYGIVYASMAGYNTSAVVTEDDKVNFFEDWLTALDPARIPGIHKDPSHPSPMQRAETIKARLRQVIENVQVFNLGVLFYQTGEYQKAILAFQEFLKYFPSREVYHNLASSHHQLALTHYQAWKGEKNAMLFKLSMAIDPSTLAMSITLKGGSGTGPEELFRENIEKAVEFYNKAISQDPSYYLSYNNLGCALILKDEPHKAVGMFKDALKIRPDFAEALNNIGVAFYYAENPAKARENLTKAREIDPSYDAPLFNLARIAQEEKNAADAKKYGEAYLRLDPDSPWADSVRAALSMERPKVTTPASAHKENENILGLETGAENKDVSASWGKPTISTIPLEEEPFKTALYPNGIMTVSQRDEIIMIVSPERFHGKSGRGISIGSSAKEVLSSYGTPSKMLNMTQGATWAYQADKIAFRMRDNKVVSWVIF